MKNAGFEVLFFLIPVIGCLHSCGNKNESTSPPSNDLRVERGYVIIPAKSPILKKIRLEEVAYYPYAKEVTASAEIEVNPTKMAKITPPLSGRVIKIFVKIGQNVHKGEPLFSMDSPDFTEAQKDYLASTQQVNQAQINLNRQNDLLTHGVGIKKEAEEAETDLRIKRNELKQTIAKLQLYGINIHGMKFGEPLMVRSPVEGDIISINMTPDQFKNDPNEVLLTVADLSYIWFTADVKEKDIRFIKEGEFASAQVSAYPEKKFTGRILFISDVLDEENHALKVRTEVENKEELLKPGMFATIIFSDSSNRGILVPARALLQKEDSSFVYVQKGSNIFERRMVETEETIGTKVKVAHGLKPGEKIISEGAFYLLSAD